MDKRFKQYPIEAPTFTDRKMSFVISTAGVDRDNDTIDPKGWDIGHYLKNPVVLWAHSYDQLPVAKATRLVQTDKGLSADIEFPPFGTYPFADTVHDMLKTGFLSATSVGFKPTKAEKNEERAQGHQGFFAPMDFKEQQLLEFSIVPVPSNPEALVTQRHTGVDTAVVKAWCKDIMAWVSKQIDDGNARLAVESYLVAQDAWKDFAKDYTIEADGKFLAHDRLVKLLQLHKLITVEATAQPDTKELAKQIFSHLPELVYQNTKSRELPELEEVDLDVIPSWIEQDEINISTIEVQQLVQECVHATVAQVVGDGVRSAMRKLQGKVD